MLMDSCASSQQYCGTKYVNLYEHRPPPLSRMDLNHEKKGKQEIGKRIVKSRSNLQSHEKKCKRFLDWMCEGERWAFMKLRAALSLT